MKKIIAFICVVSVTTVASLTLAVCSMHPALTREPMIAMLVLYALVLTVLRLKERIGRVVIVAAVFALVGVNIGDNYHNRPAVSILCASIGVVVALIRPRWLLIAIVVSVSTFFCHLHGDYVHFYPKTDVRLADFVRFTLNDPIVSSLGAVALTILLEWSLTTIETPSQDFSEVQNGNSNLGAKVARNL